MKCPDVYTMAGDSLLNLRLSVGILGLCLIEDV